MQAGRQFTYQIGWDCETFLHATLATNQASGQPLPKSIRYLRSEVRCLAWQGTSSALRVTAQRPSLMLPAIGREKASQARFLKTLLGLGIGNVFFGPRRTKSVKLKSLSRQTLCMGKLLCAHLVRDVTHTRSIICRCVPRIHGTASLEPSRVQSGRAWQLHLLQPRLRPIVMCFFRSLNAIFV